MLCNVGKVDRIVRALTGIVLISVALYFIPTMVPKVLLLAIATGFLLSSWFGVCFIYRLLGRSTARPQGS